MTGCREREVHDCCLESYGVIYFSNVWWDHTLYANYSGVKREHCSADTAPGSYVMATVCCGLNRPDGGVEYVI